MTAPGDYLCAACALPGETTASVRGIGRCARCPRRTGRQLVGVAPAGDDVAAPAVASAPPPGPPPAPPFPAAAAIQYREERPRTALPPPAPARFGPRRDYP